MLKVLEASGGDVLGVEIEGGYTLEDEEAFRQAFENVLDQGYERVNILIRIDRLDLSESDFKAFWKDSVYSLKNMPMMRHLAIVGDSKVQKWLVKMDNLLLGDPTAELVEKYFDVADIDRAWDFVRS